MPLMARLCADLVALLVGPVVFLTAFFGLGDVIGRRRFAGIGGVLRELGDLALQRLDLQLRGLPLRIELAQVSSQSRRRNFDQADFRTEASAVYRDHELFHGRDATTDLILKSAPEEFVRARTRERLLKLLPTAHASDLSLTMAVSPPLCTSTKLSSPLAPFVNNASTICKVAAARRLERVFAALAEDADFEEIFMHSTIIRVHQHGAGAKKKGGPQTIGRSRRGLTTKTHAVVEALGNPAHWRLTPGQAADVSESESLLDGIAAKAVAADKGYDSQSLIDAITRRSAQAVSSTRTNRTELPTFDRHIYKARNLVERFFCRIRHFRRVATRRDKLDGRYQAFIAISAAWIWLLNDNTT